MNREPGKSISDCVYISIYIYIYINQWLPENTPAEMSRPLRVEKETTKEKWKACLVWRNVRPTFLLSLPSSSSSLVRVLCSSRLAAAEYPFLSSPHQYSSAPKPNGTRGNDPEISFPPPLLLVMHAILIVVMLTNNNNNNYNNNINILLTLYFYCTGNWFHFHFF